MYYGYHRVSTKEQHLDRGVTGIETFCKERGYALQKVYVDKISGKTFDRPRYTVLKEDVLREGDTLIVFELDRLGRDKAGIAAELTYFRDNGIRVMFLDIPTTTIEVTSFSDELSRIIMETVNNILIELVSVNAQAERDRARKRCAEGRTAMRERGEWERYGRPRRMPADEFARHYTRVERKEIGSLALMRELGLTRDTFFRYIRELKSTHGE